MTAGGFRDGSGQRVAYTVTRDPETWEEVKGWGDVGEAFPCGLRPVTLADAERLGIQLSAADYSLHCPAGTPLTPQDRVRVTDPRHPDGLLLEIVRVQDGPVKVTVLCQGVTL